MASKIIFATKLVGTISLGLLTGVSYTVSTLTVPVILDLPSASHASRAFGSLTKFTSSTVGILAGASGAQFLLSFVLSPRGHRHPYLLYTGLFCIAAGLTDTVAPYVLPSTYSSPSGSSLAKRRAALAQARRQEKQASAAAAAAKRMEQSYEVLGASTADSHSEGATASESGGDFAYQEEEINGEEVRGEVQAFVKRQLVQTVVAGVGFAMSVVGIWGDGVTPKVVIVRG